jgi:Bifunctional DNA primase/polymerase, N-terminal/Primase C terminal 1 (PriCT-1)
MINFEWVERYVERGFACHWLHGKAPYQKGWADLPVATVDELRCSYFPGNNLGIRVGKWSVLEPGYGLVILDIDLRDDVQSVACYEGVERLLGHSQLNVASGRGLGGHVYLKCPLEKLPSKAAITVAQGDGWKLELFSTGKQVVAPPSVHPDTGKPYRWIRGEIDAVPDALLETEVYVARGNSEQAQREASTHSSSLGIPEGRRASTLARWARGFQGGGYSDDQVRQFIQSKNLRDCKPPLDAWEVEKIVRWALAQPKGR